MDFLSKKKEYIFLNNKQALVRVHVKQVSNKPYDIWVEGRSKNYRDCVNLLNKVLPNFAPKIVPPIIVVSDKKLGSGAISSYNHVEDVIYFNNYYHNSERINKIVKNKYFASNSLKSILSHEIAHKMHWDAVKRFYKANKTKYNCIEDAKREADAKIRNYIIKQGKFYLSANISMYASSSFEIAKHTNSINAINEIIAEDLARDFISDPILHKLIRGELNYGKN